MRPVEQDGCGAGEGDGERLSPRRFDARVRDVSARAQSRPCLEALCGVHGNLQHLQQTVARVTLGSKVPVAEECGVHCCHYPAPQPTAPSGEVCDEPVDASVQKGGAEVAGKRMSVLFQTLRSAAAQSAAEVAPQQPQRRKRLCPAACSFDCGASFSVARDEHCVIGQARGLPPVLSVTDAHGYWPAKSSEDDATTPRSIFAAVSRQVRAALDSGETRAIC